MQIELDPQSEVPLYQQLRDAVVAQIASGLLKQGDALDSVRRVAASFGINPATVVKAYDALRQAGLIEANRRSGYVVVRDPASGAPGEAFVANWTAAARALVSEALAQGLGADRAIEIFSVEAEAARRRLADGREGDERTTR
jgi:DNA-binding transcriptional regulator YhcF (GntR family)